MKELVLYIWNMSGVKLAIILVSIFVALLIPILLIQLSAIRSFRHRRKDFNEMRERVRSRLRK